MKEIKLTSNEKHNLLWMRIFNVPVISKFVLVDYVAILYMPLNSKRAISSLL